MRPLKDFLRILSEDELLLLHEGAVELLQNPGMKVENEELLKPLAARGAQVDFQSEVVRFPPRLIEETLSIALEEERERFSTRCSTVDASNALTFSWHTPFRERTPPVQASLGGGCPQYYDHGLRETRLARADDFLRMVHLAEGVPEILTVGNAVHYLKESDGTDVDPVMVAIKGAASVAQHSSKPGCTAVMDWRQLEFLVEIGTIVRGSLEEYLRRPILVNIHDTEPPLRVTRPEAAIMAEMIKKGLGIFILPMPMAGISGPVYPIANAIIGAAEILGVWTMAKALREDTPVEAAVVSGSLNPKTGAVCFTGPEALLQDLAVAQLFRERYGLRCGTGPGIIDAPVPGPLSIYERTLKSVAAALAGEPSFDVGILGGGVVFSPEQMIIDLDIARAHHGLCRGIGGNRFEESLALIRERGIGGLFVDTDHTVAHFREELWIPDVLIRFKGSEAEHALRYDPVDEARERWHAILSRTEPYEIDSDRRGAIERVVRRAEACLCG